MSLLDGSLRNAANNGELAKVQSLLAQGADPNAVNSHGETALHLAVNNGHLTVVRLLLEAGSDPSIASQGRMTPLALACAKKGLDFVEALLDAQSPSQATLDRCMRWAILRLDPELVELLLARGARANRPSRSGRPLVDEVERWCQQVAAEDRGKCQTILALLRKWKVKQ